MAELEELRVEFSEAELKRIREAANAKGVDVETWAREVLLRILRERDRA